MGRPPGPERRAGGCKVDTSFSCPFDHPGTAPGEDALLLPLNVGLAYGQNAWEAASTNGGENRSYTFTLPRRNLRFAHVDVYASGHGCEEFWYT